MIERPPIPDGFYFDEEKHLYFLDRAPLLGVTSVLAATGISDYSSIPYRDRALYLARGKAVHASCLLFVQGQFDTGYLQTIPDNWRLPIVQGLDFIENSGAEILLAEKPVFDERLGCAGTFDLLVRWQGRLALPDLKTTEAQKSTAIQTAAYESMLSSLNDPRRRDGVSYPFTDQPHERMAIVLPTDGAKWKVRFYSALENLYDHAIWNSALAVAGWMMRCNGRLTRAGE